MRGWLENSGYLNIPIWKSIYGPGGDREYILDYLAIVCDKYYRTMTAFPSWVLYIGSGALATLLVQFLHRGSTTKFEEEKARRRQAAAVAAAPSSSAGGGKPLKKGSDKQSSG